MKLLGLLFLLLPALAQAQEVSWKLIDTKFQVGRPFGLEVTLARPLGSNLLPPLVTQNQLGQGFLFIQARELPTITQDQEELLSVTYQILPLREGTQELAPLAGSKNQTQPLLLQVAPGQLPPAAPMPPLPAPWSPWPLVLAVLCLPLVYFLKIKSKPQTPRHTQSPQEVALGNLRALEEKLPGLQAEPIYRELSWILRSYLEEAKGLKALSQTTAEFLAAPATGQNLNRLEQNRLSQFLQFSDQVKFAQLQAGPTVAQEALEAVRQLVGGDENGT